MHIRALACMYLGLRACIQLGPESLHSLVAPGERLLHAHELGQAAVIDRHAGPKVPLQLITLDKLFV